MEAGVGRGQHRGQRCTSCMLGNAALFFLFFFFSLPHLHHFSAYFYFLMPEQQHTPCAHVYTHTHTLIPYHSLLFPISFIPVSFSPFSLSLSFSLSRPHTLIRSRLSPSLFIFALFPFAYRPSPPLPSLRLRTHLTLICKWREDLTEKYCTRRRCGFPPRWETLAGDDEGGEEEDGEEEEGSEKEEENRHNATTPSPSRLLSLWA